MNLTFRYAVLAVCVCAAIGSQARAAAVYGTSVGAADYSGERVYFSSAGEEAKILWEITDNGGTFTYRYTFSIPDIDGPDAFKSVSHFTLDLSDNFDEDDASALIQSAASNSVDFDVEAIEFGDKDTLTGAVKFDFGGGKPDDGSVEGTDGDPLYYEFTIDRAPVWGNFAVKDGNGLFVNPALAQGTVLTSMDINDFIAVPNGHAPEPGTLALAVVGAAGVLGLGVRRRLRRK